MSTFFDDAFTHIAEQSGGIQNLLDNFFGFLHRRSDFYIESKSISKMGFPQGVAKAMVLQSFHKYSFVAYSDELSILNQKGNCFNIESHNGPSQKPDGRQSKTEDRPLVNGKQIPVGNGGCGSKYTWTQSLEDITVYVDIPFNVSRNGIICIIQKYSLLFNIEGVKYIEGTLENAIIEEDSMWTISRDSCDETSSQLVIFLAKKEETWWKSVIVGDPEIDTNKVDSSKLITDYDPDTQAAIRKLLAKQNAHES